MAISQRRTTLEEFLTWPEEKPALEYAGGRVAQKVSPKLPHSFLQLRSAELINRFAEPRRLAIALPELRTTYAGTSTVPDVCVFTWERVPIDEHGSPVEDVVVPPDIAIEIESPGQRLGDLMDRCRWYVEHDVRIALLIRPRQQVVMLFRPGEEPRSLRGADRIDLDPVLPGFQLTVGELFEAARLR